MYEGKLVIRHAESDVEILHCWEPVSALRPHVKKEDFVRITKEMMAEGYRMAYVEENGKAIAFSGYREMQMFYSGRIIYIDDLSTLEDHRGKGCGSLLLEYIHQLAKQKGMNAVHLDSGHLRHTAHRLYLNKGYDIVAHHFVKLLPA